MVLKEEFFMSIFGLIASAIACAVGSGVENSKPAPPMSSEQIHNVSEQILGKPPEEMRKIIRQNYGGGFFGWLQR